MTERTDSHPFKVTPAHTATCRLVAPVAANVQLTSHPVGSQVCLLRCLLPSPVVARTYGQTGGQAHRQTQRGDRRVVAFAAIGFTLPG